MRIKKPQNYRDILLWAVWAVSVIGKREGWYVALVVALVAAVSGGVAARMVFSYPRDPDGQIGLTATPIDAVSIAAIDPSANACENFYQRACGGFIAATKLTATRPMVAMKTQQFNDNLDRNLRALFAQNVSDDPELGRLKTFFASCETADPSGVELVKSWLGRINGARTRPAIEKLIRDLTVIGVDPFVVYEGQPDPKDWSHYRGEIRPSSLWAEPGTVESAFVLAGVARPEAHRDAQTVASTIAALRTLRGDRYNAKEAEHPLTISRLETLAPAMEWPLYLKLADASRGEKINVTSLSYLRAVNRLIATRPPSQLRALLRWSFLFSLRGELPSPYNQAFGDIIPPLRVNLNDPSARCRDATVRAMGVEFSRQYSKRILGLPTRDAARAMAEDIKRQVVASIADDIWLAPEARRATADKLSKTDLKIGFPDRWPTVGNYAIRANRFLENVLSARAFEQQRAWHRAGQERSRSDWEMIVSPWVGEGMAAARLVVPNGYPDAFSNSLIMTAAFLAKPRFDAAASLETNYATFGAIFAHEFVHVAETHEFGPDGRPMELWSDAGIKAGDMRHQCVIDQADSYEPLSGLKMSGRRQLGENLADYGGVRLAFDALYARIGARIYQVDAAGTSPAQRFFTLSRKTSALPSQIPIYGNP